MNGQKDSVSRFGFGVIGATSVVGMQPKGATRLRVA